MNKKAKRIAVTGAAGQIAYSLLFRLAAGELFGPDQPIVLSLLEVPEAVQALEGVKMELDDCAYPLVESIHVSSDPYEGFKDVDVAFLVGAKPRGPGMERGDLLQANGKIFSVQGKALNAVASRDVRVLVVGNPCNTNCLIAIRSAPDLPAKNFHAMTRLDQNRAVGLLSHTSKVPVGAVKGVMIWGNHSSTQVPCIDFATIEGRAVREVIPDQEWLNETFVGTVRQRGAAIISARGKSSAASAANAAIDAMRALFVPTPEGEWFSTGVFAEGNPYGIDQGLVYSFPCRSNGNGDWEYIQGLEIGAELEGKLRLSEHELIEEREAAGVTVH